MSSDPDRRTGGSDEIAMRAFSASLPMALLRARESAMRHFRPLLAAHDLTEQQWRVLRALAGDGAMEVTTLAARTELLAPSVSRIVARLTEADLLRRGAVASDGRRSTLELTPQGRDLVNRIAPHSERIYGEIEAAFGADRLATLLRELDELAMALDPDRADSPASEAS